MAFIELTLGFIMATFGAVLLPAFVYLVLATALALILGWGSVGFDETKGTRVFKMPGGGLLASLPIPEFVLLGLLLVLNPELNVALSFLTLGLVFFIVLRLLAWFVVHLLTIFGSAGAKRVGLDFSLECMDGRCSHGGRSGNFLHNWACGGYTLLTALGFAPLVIVPVVFGLPAGTLGLVVLAICIFPYPFVVAKLLAGRFGDTGQVFVKGVVDVLMFITEFPGWIVGSITLSLAALRPMWPGITKTRIH